MVDNKTSHLELPLPNLGNQQDEDVPRIAEALAGLDAHAAKSDARMAVAEAGLGEAVVRIDVLGDSAQEHQGRLNSLDKQLEEVNARTPDKAEFGKLGLVMPGRGLHITNPGELDVDIATVSARGIGRVATAADSLPGSNVTNGPAFLDAETVKITPTPTANAIPQADAQGNISLAWLGSMLCNVREIITTSGSWVAKSSGWHKVMLIGAGGAAGDGGDLSAPGYGGGQGGNTSFGSTVAQGGPGGGGAAIRGGSYGCSGGGGGGAGGVVIKLIYLKKGQSISCVIGAGGLRGQGTTSPGDSGSGKNGVGSQSGVGGMATRDAGQGGGNAGNGMTPYNGNVSGGHGGNGEPTGLGFGGGGGGGAGASENASAGTNGFPGHGKDSGSDGIRGAAGYKGLGGNGGNGAIIIEYFDPSVTA